MSGRGWFRWKTSIFRHCPGMGLSFQRRVARQIAARDAPLERTQRYFRPNRRPASETPLALTSRASAENSTVPAFFSWKPGREEEGKEMKEEGRNKYENEEETEEGRSVRRKLQRFRRKMLQQVKKERGRKRTAG